MTALQDSAQKELRRLLEQIERLQEEKKELGKDISEKFAEGKAKGFDTKAMRRMLRLRRMSEAERSEEEAIDATYMQALGMLADTPLGEFAAEQVKAVRNSRKQEAEEAEAAA